MNYPWGFTGGAGGETAFWTNFAGSSTTSS